MSSVLTQSAAWQALLAHREWHPTLSLADLFRREPRRLDDFEVSFEGLTLNYALQAVTAETLGLLVKLAEQQKLEDQRTRMFRGDKVNTTEGRAVLHTALRRKEITPLMVDGRDIMPNIAATRLRIKRFVADVREGHWRGASGKPIRHIVNIGIGGSDLGPRLAVRALAPYATGPEAHFVANADAFDLESILKKIDPGQTMFVVVSKTFTTQETLLNARTARQWLTSSLGETAVDKHFAAVSVNRAEVEHFGIAPENMFPMWDWVGGRFSLWSAVGLSVALAVGYDHFSHLLDGAAAMDRHFLTAPLAANMPVLMGLLGIWNRNFHDASSLAILPYCERLRELPRFLQQLDMESNGKSVTRDGLRLDYKTAPVIFGECGTVGQHSFHQDLHQGTDIIPADFIGVSTDDLDRAAHHRAVLANMAAQAAALACGQTEARNAADIYPGNRPSNVLMLDRLDPYRLGLLLALYEHKIFVQGAIWDINSFDQPGVELGKRMAKALEAGPSQQETARKPGDEISAHLFAKFTALGRSDS
jgi:glucose-6-phosphate isomerase